MEESDDKRDFLRMPIDCDLSFKVADSSREFMGNVINLSDKGILFTSRVGFEVGTLLEITLTPSHTGAEPFHTAVVVSRSSNDHEALFELACEFRNTTPQFAL